MTNGCLFSVYADINFAQLLKDFIYPQWSKTNNQWEALLFMTSSHETFEGKKQTVTVQVNGTGVFVSHHINY